jgi:hypothetical protein
MRPKALSYKISIVFSIILFLKTNEMASAQNKIRSIEELTADTSGWPYLKESLKTAKNEVEILPADPAKAKEALYQTQVTTHSTMGAIVYYTGGILVDNGWIRILGSGSEKLNRSLPEWNKGKSFTTSGEQPKFLLIADDAVGGFFAINNGALGKDIGNVYYLSPDNLKWESLDRGYTDFLDFCFNGDLGKYYEGLRWDTWKNDLKNISGTSALHILPPLWTKEGKDINKDSRKSVPIQELYDLTIDTIIQLSKQ